MIKYLIPVFVLISCNAVEQHAEQELVTKPQKSVRAAPEEKEIPAPGIESQAKEDAFSMSVFFVEGHGWGYKIFNHDKLFINQPNIPSLSGNSGFETAENALITAEYIVVKLENGVFPPTISPEELDSLGVLYH